MPKIAVLLDCFPGERVLVAYIHGEPMLQLLRRITHRLLSSERDVDHSTGMLLVNGRPIDDYREPIHLCLGYHESPVVVSYFAARQRQHQHRRQRGPPQTIGIRVVDDVLDTLLPHPTLSERRAPRRSTGLIMSVKGNPV